MTKKDQPQTANPRLAAIKAKAEKAKRDLAALQDAQSDSDREEIESRREAQEAAEQLKDAKNEQRQLDLDRRLDEAREAHPKHKLAGLLIDGYPDSFIVRSHHPAFEEWQEKITKASTSKKVSRQLASRAFAMKAVIDWNGQDLSHPSANGNDLVQYFKTNVGIVTSVVTAAVSLTGAYTEAQKS